MDQAQTPTAASAHSDFVRIENVTKSFGSVAAVKDVSINIGKGELFALLGGSGCGKTTLLRILAGFETPTSGRIVIDGKDMTKVPPYERPINMMFQSYALFPHMSVEKNVAYGLKHDAMSASERKDRARQMLDLVQLSDLAHRKPHQLSGGQRQRVALARSLAKHPKVLLLDEPLGALDKKLREHTQFEIANIQYKTGITFVVVTHDQEEAMTLADRIAVMDRGTIRQIGSASEVYEYPNCAFVAGFIGSINMFDGTIKTINGTTKVGVPMLGATLEVGENSNLAVGQNVKVAVRPEKINISRDPPPAPMNRIEGTVDDLAYFGKDSLYRVKLATGVVLQANNVNSHRDQEGGRVAQWGDKVWLSFEPSSVILLRD
ncbi:MAG: ABC transporter ATP-binding protein [Mesorhizobium sp.]|nr:ABC transporter ATP-binding protein [Mesorhizobium sp.]RWG00860.1 MAG: ABC transporter ATP-binding protein [Mesorhizobium sp.]RWG96581.1 MAG: ABC transporter ATP-binding protein [Mesorhizobium sp.]TIN48728.1 MAG: ABC transporter ATP-binding protein [Mesorhizobium sp.]TIR91635.1 MAG: ABC transporter ATP-binding protein [Mesorhizobium sp.]